MRIPFLRRTESHHPDEPDVLTDRTILARWYVLRRLDEELARAQRFGRPLCVLVARPKSLPGERLVPEAVTAATEIAQALSRSTDLLGWLEDDSFLIIMPETTEIEARAAAFRWRNEMSSQTRHMGGKEWSIVTEVSAEGQTAEELLQATAGRLAGQSEEQESERDRQEVADQAERSPEGVATEERPEDVTQGPARSPGEEHHGQRTWRGRGGQATPSGHRRAGAREAGAPSKIGALRTGLLLVAAAASTLVFVLAAFEGSIPTALLAVIPPVLIVGSLVRRVPGRSSSHSALVQKAAEHADAGRKLVIYERETGLFAHWYIALRCEEECYRAGRYGWPFTLLLVEPEPDADVWAVQEQLADWLRQKLRKSDIAGYLGNGRYVVLMPETDLTGAQTLVGRLSDGVEHAERGLSAYPDDGGSIDQLVAAAASRLGHASEPAA